MVDFHFDMPGWSEWQAGHNFIDSKLRGASRINLEAYFLMMHAATEAMFRRILFVGLRLNEVSYKEANNWLYHNDDTPERKNYTKLFDKLYEPKNITWCEVVASVPELDELWELWIDYSKIIRNHISHGIRKYEENWLNCGISIDQELLVRLDLALLPVVGGSVVGDLRNLKPRLPIVAKRSNLSEITGRKDKKPRPTISLAKALAKIESLRTVGPN